MYQWNPTAKIPKKIQKNNHVNLCSTRDPIHIHTVINRFRAIASPPRGHRKQVQRSCPLWEEPPEGILDILLCALVFFLFFGILLLFYKRKFAVRLVHCKSLKPYKPEQKERGCSFNLHFISRQCANGISYFALTLATRRRN